MKKLNYSQKRQIILSAIAVISIIMVTIFCVMIIFMIYGESLFSAKKVQLKKAENYATLSESTPKEGVVFLGDSIFEMYDLKKYFKHKDDYINRGISSNESADVLARLQTNVVDVAPKVVIIHVGVNDIGHNVSAEDYIINMSKIITELTTKLPNCKIMVDSIYPTVTLNNFNSMNLTTVRSNDDINNFNLRLKSLCNTKNITYINTHDSLLKDDALNKTYSLDGLHLSDAGYRIVSGIFQYHIEDALAEK